MRHKLHCPVCYKKFNQKRYNHNASGCFFKQKNIACNFCGEEHKITECAQFRRQTSNARASEYRPRSMVSDFQSEHYPTSRESEHYSLSRGNVDDYTPYRTPGRPEGFHPYPRNGYHPYPRNGCHPYQRTFDDHRPYSEDLGHRYFRREAFNRSTTGYQEYRAAPSSRTPLGQPNVFPQEPLTHDFESHENRSVWNDRPMFGDWMHKGHEFPRGSRCPRGKVEGVLRDFPERRSSPVRETIKRQSIEEARETSVETGQIDDLFKDILDEE